MNAVNDIAKPSITRLARRAGVKSVSDECYSVIRQVLSTCLNNVIETSLIVNSEHNTKTLMPRDVYNALNLMEFNITPSGDFGV